MHVNKSVRIVAIVCIAVFALTAITAVPMFAALDAQLPIDPLFDAPSLVTPVPLTDDHVLPVAPVFEVRSPRAPPQS